MEISAKQHATNEALRNSAIEQARDNLRIEVETCRGKLDRAEKSRARGDDRPGRVEQARDVLHVALEKLAEHDRVHGTGA